ncbi:SDR family oxidoreductase [Catelliglobosispora koreensis]|uniref:SDR family oxidoreductase n=1 Tax=Catelliglobosispora koreensis TaxID=129052 RepID=UPI0003A38497|nr:SDR family oxidoreductase [Catelliglobosispora koreensis]
MTRRWLVTGCSSGLGRALAEELAARGERVLATARKPETISDLAARYPSHVAVTALDVCDPHACASAVALAQEVFGGVDVLVNNAGYGQFGAVEEISDAELEAQFDTNVFGPWRLAREVLPLWRAQGSGHAIFVSSLAATVPLPGLAVYGASKAALEGLANALAADAGAFGVKVTSLQLGGFSTRYGEALREPAHPIAAYAPVTAEMLAGTRALASTEDITAPALFARLVLKIASMAEPPLNVPFGSGIEDYLAGVMTARYEEFQKALAGGWHLPEWAD